jgi:hypothetical protein
MAFERNVIPRQQYCPRATLVLRGDILDGHHFFYHTKIPMWSNNHPGKIVSHPCLRRYQSPVLKSNVVMIVRKRNCYAICHRMKLEFSIITKLIVDSHYIPGIIKARLSQWCALSGMRVLKAQRSEAIKGPRPMFDQKYFHTENITKCCPLTWLRRTNEIPRISL